MRDALKYYVQEASASLIKTIFDWRDYPQDFKNKIDYYLDNPNERQEIAKAGKKFVLENHSNFHRCAQILSYFNCETESAMILEAWKNIRSQANA